MTNSTQISNRLDWVDWAKFIAIYLVVFGHMPSPLNTYIFAFHMPFFFLISGYLQKRRPVRQEAVKSLKSLMVPYIIYNVYLLCYSMFTGEYNSAYPLAMLLGNQWYLSMACRPLWFLWALFVSRLLYSLLPQRGSQLLAVVCMVLCLFCNGTALMKPETNWFQLWCAVECFPFFVLGSTIKEFKIEKLTDRLSLWVAVPVLIAVMAAGIYLTTLNGYVNIFRLHPGNNALLFYLNAALISTSLFILIRRTLDISNSYVRLVSDGTMLIFALHQSILWPMHSLLSTLPWGVIALIALATIVLLSAFIWFSRRYCPVLIGKWK